MLNTVATSVIFLSQSSPASSDSVILDVGKSEVMMIRSNSLISRCLYFLDCKLVSGREPLIEFAGGGFLRRLDVLLGRHCISISC